ncbi:small subunit ribosomal protein S6 [Sporomusaceae bacterium BoRhaA]|uniref:30S ribosomal protein S6 n=1 Tax=Pelorhabdus rhamnosifermentans TaxID=2772457 RepID=UPI001C0648CE|nr:30S ribosomal protein S6 [Pelorhabdus rhamnosifermentans]MBU2700646.1 small subunit ribosomal protein S6 [Pelorhabdus rhamnosifermentans]
MRKYEVVFIFKVLEEEATNTVVTKFENLIKNNGGEIEKIDRWGKKRLAYEIKDMTDGYYVLVHFNAEPATVKELDRVAKITEEVLKHMIVKVDEK